MPASIINNSPAILTYYRKTESNEINNVNSPDLMERGVSQITFIRNSDSELLKKK